MLFLRSWTYSLLFNNLSGIKELSSHVSRHSFAYHMLESGASIEEISFALGHATVQQTQGYLKQFPQKFADKAIKVFEDSFEL